MDSYLNKSPGLISGTFCFQETSTIRFVYFYFCRVKVRENIPNAITSFNLLCGCLSVAASFDGYPATAAIFIFAAAAFDFFDGMAARLLKVQSEIGKQLDSLADIISFGVAPTIILVMLLRSTLNVYYASTFLAAGAKTVQYFPFVLVVFSAFRLAKFNVDTRQHDSFIGVPTPANAIFIASLPLIIESNNSSHFLGIGFMPGHNFIGELFANLASMPSLIFGYSVVMSYLLVSELPLFALKFKTLSWEENKIKFIFLILSLLLFFVLNVAAIPIIIILYIVLSIINNQFVENKS